MAGKKNNSIRIKVLELYNKGLTNKDIAKELGYKGSNAITPYIKELGLKSNCDNNLSLKETLTDREYQILVHKIKHCAELGWTKRKTYKILNISHGNLYTIIKNEGIKFNNTDDIKRGKASKLTLEERTKIFADSLNKKDNTKIYYSGFTNVDSDVDIKCLLCGNIYKINASVIRRKSNYIYCQHCEDIKKENIRIEKQKQKQINEKVKEEEHKRQKRINKLLKSKQVTFSICNHCGSLFYTASKKIYCSNRCANRHHEYKHSRQRIDNARKNGQVDYTITLDKLIKRDNNICYICNKECNLNDYTYINNAKVAGNYYPSIDHVIPLAKSGTHSWDNVRLAHRICNILKSDNTKPLGE